MLCLVNYLMMDGASDFLGASNLLLSGLHTDIDLELVDFYLDTLLGDSTFSWEFSYYLSATYNLPYIA